MTRLIKVTSWDADMKRPCDELDLLFADLKTPGAKEYGVSAEAVAFVKSRRDSSSGQSAGPALEVDTTRSTRRTPATLLSAFGKSQSKKTASRFPRERTASAAACAPVIAK
jgi:hypothetical protein